LVAFVGVKCGTLILIGVEQFASFKAPRVLAGAVAGETVTPRLLDVQFVIVDFQTMLSVVRRS
jgi:hypothetical protein